MSKHVESDPRGRGLAELLAEWLAVEMLEEHRAGAAENFTGKDAEPVHVPHKDPTQAPPDVDLPQMQAAMRSAVDAAIREEARAAASRMIIAVDFDGTLCEARWPDIGPERWPVIDAVRDAQRQGARIILWTNRCGDLLAEAVEWCAARGLHFDAVNENLPEIVEQYGSESRKISADVYVDDKALAADVLERRLRAVDARKTWFETVGKTENEKEESPMRTNADYIKSRPELTAGAVLAEAERWYAKTHTKADAETAGAAVVLAAWLTAERPADATEQETTLVTTLSVTHVLHGISADDVLERGMAQRIADHVLTMTRRGWSDKETEPDDISIARVQVFPTTGEAAGGTV